MFRVVGDLRHLWPWSCSSSCVLAARHASSSPRLKPGRRGKRPDLWTPEEVSENLCLMEEQIGQGQTPSPKQLAMLLPPIRCHRNPDDLSRVLRVVQRSKVPLNESLGSALVSGLAEAGRVADVKLVVEQMQGRLRVQSQSSVLSLACQKMDTELALEYLARWDTLQPIPEPVVQSLVALSHKSGRLDVVERLLRVLRDTRQALGDGSAAELRLWAESQPQPFVCRETSVSSSGVCSNCMGQLEKALPEADHQQLLEAVTDAVHSEGLGFSPELISNLTSLQQRLASMSTPYRVVVDGLNVSRVASKNFSVMQVMDIVNQLTWTLGGPVLVVARKHLAREMDQLPASLQPNQDFHIFTTHINEISDDICVIYAALTTGPNCYFVSNDHMSDNASMLSPRHSRLFAMWQASRQITVHPSNVCLLYPADHSQLVQWSETSWHIPLSQTTPTKPQATPTNQDTWLLEGRQRWEYCEDPQRAPGQRGQSGQPGQSNQPGQPGWLCLTRTDIQ